MAKFSELLGLMREPGENGIPDTIYDDLEFAYADEIAAIAQEKDGATAKIQELESHISRLKTQNYDLLMSSGSSGDDGGNGEGDNSDPDPEPNDDDNKGVDDLFG